MFHKKPLQALHNLPAEVSKTDYTCTLARGGCLEDPPPQRTHFNNVHQCGGELKEQTTSTVRLSEVGSKVVVKIR